MRGEREEGVKERGVRESEEVRERKVGGEI